MSVRSCLISTVPAVLLLTSLDASATKDKGGDAVEIPCLQGEVEVILDRDGVPHIYAANDRDLYCAQGYIHARDRLFQMDLTRREVSGDLAEVLGPSVVGRDVQSRTVGLRRAAERSKDEALMPGELVLLEAYAAGVNASIANNPLPVEYGLLGLTSVRPWTVIDSLVIGKAIAAQLSLDIDTGPTSDLLDYIGALGNFAGPALYFDVHRSAPMDPASTVPDATGATPFIAQNLKASSVKLARMAKGAKRVQEKLAKVPWIAHAMNRREREIGSNEWGVAGENAAGGRPIIANDPHLSLNIPATFYEWHLNVDDDPAAGPMNVSGIGFPGAPGVILGQNEHVTWGATTNPMDVSDVFSDQLIVGGCPMSLACITSEGSFYPVKIEPAEYFANVNGTLQKITDGNILTVDHPFRSFGPILDVTDPSVFVNGGVTTALVLQYTGFHPTRELSAFVAWNRARNLGEFLAGLADFDVGSQNWAYADDQGNLAYFSSAENPLRKDLEQGIPGQPFFVRDGSGPENWIFLGAAPAGQAIPFAILPFEEMPQTVNPEKGFFVNANNDPAGVTLDNDPLNQYRESNPDAIYYLNPSYAIGMRAGRITRLLRDQIEAGKKIKYGDMQRFQANNQQLDAELMTPFLLEAFENAGAPGAPPELAALAADPKIAEAVGRLSQWDYSTPTGIPEGYDAHDNKGKRTPSVPKKEAEASVAATIYNMWRSKTIIDTIDAQLDNFGLETGSGDALKTLFFLLSQDPFTGQGTLSGIDLFPVIPGLSEEQARDVALLGALRDALDKLASADFAPAFASSTNQDDYRWGKLHRITFDHPFVDAFDIPPSAGFDNVSPELSGLARDGGYNVVNASGFSARAFSLDAFKFGGGPVRRYVGQGNANWGPVGNIRGTNVVPGGPSGDPTSPEYATQLGTWLTADYHKVRMSKQPNQANAISIETFVAP